MSMSALTSFSSNWVSLRKKIIGLALIPTLICCILFGALTWFTSIRTASLVGKELTDFMAERTSRATIHAYNTTAVTYGYVNDALTADLRAAHGLLDKEGGAHLVAGKKQEWQAANDQTQQMVLVSAPVLAVGSWQSSPASDAGAPVRAISAATGHATMLYVRMTPAGDMLRVAGATAEPGGQSDTGSYIPVRQGNGNANPILAAVLGGGIYRGSSYELGSPHAVVCDPLRNGSDVFGMLCVGASLNNIRSLQDELKDNFVGAHGAAVVFYGHGRDRGKMLVEPWGIAKDTQNLWFPQILDMSFNTKDREGGGVRVKDPASGAAVLAHYSYFEHWDYVMVVLADSRDLSTSSAVVSSGFHALLWQIAIAAILAIGLATVFALRMSSKLIDPMADLTIRLTSNATQIASSARQQAANVANINTSGNEIASAVNEISATSKELLRAMEQLATDAEKTSEAANQGSRGLKGLGTSMESLSTATRSITDKLTTIRTKAAKINSVVTAITKVADQTNLLSLNASIEAEKAGEAGAGFAVVAREIRRLADQSAIATMEIEQMVEAMQEAVSSGVAESRDLTEAMDRGIEASERISGQFGDIIHRVESMAPRYEAVHEGMQNQSEGAQQISEAMWQLTEMGRQTSESVNDMNSVSLQLHEAVRILKEKIIHTASGEDSSTNHTTLFGK